MDCDGARKKTKDLKKSDSPKWQLARWIFCGIFSFAAFRFPNWDLEFYDVASTVHVGYSDTPAKQSRMHSTNSIFGGNCEGNYCSCHDIRYELYVCSLVLSLSTNLTKLKVSR